MNPNEAVAYVFSLIKRDNGIAATLRRCDSEALQYYAWPYLEKIMGDDFKRGDKRRIYTLVVSVLARSSQTENGDIPLGKAFALINENPSEVYSSRFLRVISAENSLELCEILRPCMTYFISKGIKLDFISLLWDLLTFSSNENMEKTKAKWARQYFHGSKEE